jgi:glycosyltransferase involved in cell wall biosynthesis
LTLAASPASEFVSTWERTGAPWIAYEPRVELRTRTPDGRRPGVVEVSTQLVGVVLDAFRIAKLARSSKTDVIHSHDLNAHLEVALAGRLAGTPTVIDLHDIVVPGIGRRMLDLVARMATVVLANSAATASTVPSGRVEIVNPGVDVGRFHPGPADPTVRAAFAARPERPVVGMLGRICRQKGIDVTARAIASLNDRGEGVQLTVVGAPTTRREAAEGAQIRRFVEDLLGDRVRFVDPTEDVPAAMRALDVVVNGSWAEPFGRTVLEAQACGVPVVASAAGGIPEFVQDAVNGLLFPPGDDRSLASALESLLADPALQARLRAGGIRQAESLSVARQAAKVADLYRSVLRWR